jgi:methionyl-tRNA formyltransferase
MRLVFMGTPAFAVPALRALLEAGHDVAAVYTQPDRPAGRGRSVGISAVKRLALERGLVIEQPEKLRDPSVTERMRALGPEAIVVAAYGKILPKALLDLPPRGAINVHASLLPRHRGAAPIQRSILAGDTTTGITIMQMNERMDEGDILLQREIEIAADDTAGSLGQRLASLGAGLLVETLAMLVRGDMVSRAQDHAAATLAPMVRKEEGAIDWSKSAVEIERAVRAFDPWPGAYSSVRGKLLKVHRAAVVPWATAAPPGTIVRAAADDLRIATGQDDLRVLEVQLEGKRRLAAREFLAARPVREGERVG